MRVLKTIFISVFLNLVSLPIFAKNAEYINNKISDEDLLALRESSIQFDELLNKALEMARESLDSASFTKSFHSYAHFDRDDELISVETTISMDSFFSSDVKHVFVSRVHHMTIRYLDVFHVSNNRLIPVASHKSNTGKESSIKDINGDKYKDLVIPDPSDNGCCRANVYQVFLNKDNKGTFTEKKQFMNPTFFPNEKIIRGVDYGHPGTVALYKLKWVGFDTKAVEFIYPNIDDTKHRSFIKTKKRYPSSKIEQEKLDEVPDEYHNINHYDWFNRY